MMRRDISLSPFQLFKISLNSNRPAQGGSLKRIEIRIEYYNTKTGETGSASVETNDPDAVSANPKLRDMWRLRVQKEKAEEEGWALEDTLVVVDEESLRAAMEGRSPTKRGKGGKGDGSGRVTIRIEYWNTATGEKGAAGVQTNDPDAVSEDPELREAWRQRIRQVWWEHAVLAISTLSLSSASTPPLKPLTTHQTPRGFEPVSNHRDSGARER